MLPWGGTPSYDDHPPAASPRIQPFAGVYPTGSTLEEVTAGETNRFESCVGAQGPLTPNSTSHRGEPRNANRKEHSITAVILACWLESKCRYCLAQSVNVLERQLSALYLSG